MNESVIKEVKSIYSGRLKSVNPAAITPDIKTLHQQKMNKSFFNGVINKLNIMVSKNKNI